MTKRRGPPLHDGGRKTLAGIVPALRLVSRITRSIEDRTGVVDYFAPKISGCNDRSLEPTMARAAYRDDRRARAEGG